MKIIFLDIDGVLNSDPFLTEQHDVGFFDDIDQIDPSRVVLLNNLIERTNANIVISSSWRLQFKFEDLVKFLHKVGVKGNIVGKTPDLLHNRDLEITKWIVDNSPSNIVILEDAHDMNELDPFAVMTDPDVGLSEDDVEKAVKVLSKDLPNFNKDELRDLVLTLTEDEDLVNNNFK